MRKLNLVPLAAILCALLATGLAAKDDKCEDKSLWNKFPYVVEIEKGGRLRCLGTRIANNLVLTAAKCVDFCNSVKRLRVRSRANCGSPGCSSQFKVKSIALEEVSFQQSEYSPTRYAIIKLTSDIDSNELNNVLLHRYHYGPHTKSNTILGNRESRTRLEKNDLLLFTDPLSEVPWGPSQVIHSNLEGVSRTGSPILSKSFNMPRFVGIVSRGEFVTHYRSLVREFSRIAEAIRVNRVDPPRGWGGSRQDWWSPK